MKEGSTTNEPSLQIIKNYIDSVITMRNAIKQYFLQKIRASDLSDLTYEMFQVLAYLWIKNEVNQQDIANAVQKNKASITPLIDNLCKRGLVTRTLNPDNRRNNLISLTEKGKQYERVFTPFQEEFFQLLLTESSLTEIKQTTNTLNRLAKKALS
ncbi:MarR family winged helix-turn-helix transcriptional regulator [Olivibacter sitiensis]|uniref:MarR family winged helix-turn-helix transcriptional regulator n=1 Tax=Olivibacter sitiensis TaxID=376470 RepID=UPI000689006E|nr:MarR family winged helix-turn-helix transcriptional regulator [Olivibacter sitiensis]